MIEIKDDLKFVQESLKILLQAKDEKDTRGNTPLYEILKQNAWGNTRIALRVLNTLIDKIDNKNGEYIPAMTHADEALEALAFKESYVDLANGGNND